jgi:hypothetical protein
LRKFCHKCKLIPLDNLFPCEIKIDMPMPKAPIPLSE